MIKKFEISYKKKYLNSDTTPSLLKVIDSRKKQQKRVNGDVIAEVSERYNGDVIYIIRHQYLD